MYAKKILLSFCTALLISASTSAVPMRLDVSFSGTPTMPNFPERDDLFAGSLTYLYDSVSVPDTGTHFISFVKPATVIFTAPHVGSTTFDANNTSFSLLFQDSAPTMFWFGDALDQFSVPGGNRDDFGVLINWGSWSRIWYYVKDEGYLRVDENITWSMSVTALGVPDTTATVWLMAAGLVGVMLCRRRAA